MKLVIPIHRRSTPASCAAHAQYPQFVEPPACLPPFLMLGAAAYMLGAAPNIPGAIDPTQDHAPHRVKDRQPLCFALPANPSFAIRGHNHEKCSESSQRSAPHFFGGHSIRGGGWSGKTRSSWLSMSCISFSGWVYRGRTNWRPSVVGK